MFRSLAEFKTIKKTLMASSSYFIGPIGIFCPEHRDAALIEGK